MLHWILLKYFNILSSAQVTNRHTGMQTFCSFSRSDWKKKQKHWREIRRGERKDVTLAAAHWNSAKEKDTSISGIESKSISCIPATHKWINAQTLQTKVPWNAKHVLTNFGCALTSQSLQTHLPDLGKWTVWTPPPKRPNKARYNRKVYLQLLQRWSSKVFIKL